LILITKNSMSPQSRATISANTTFPSVSGDDESSTWPCNACSSPSSVAEIAWAANAAFALHKIEGSASSDVNPLLELPSLPKKRASALISSSSKQSLEPTSSTTNSAIHPSQPFLSSYGSAFLSGIFADIAESGEEDSPAMEEGGEGLSAGYYEDDTNTNASISLEPRPKKSRTNPSSTFGGHLKSYKALAGLTEGADSSVNATAMELSPSVVSPRPNISSTAIKIQLFNDQVRELQDLAFPSLPRLPVTVSSSSFSSSDAVGAVVTPRQEDASSSDPDQYGWFVSMDDDEGSSDDETSPPMFLPNTKPDLAFKAMVAPRPPKPEENQDIEVQQALAADTIDDVLGDLF
jgi:hypothetical protein